MKRPAPAALLLALFAGAAFAQSRPDTLRITCGEARGIVQRAGSAILGSGPNVYERYVASRAFCQQGDNTQAAFAPTRDSAQCYVGDVCVSHRPWIRPGS